MSLYRTLLRSLRRSSSLSTTTTTTQTLALHHHHHFHLQNPNFILPVRSFAFSSAEEAAAERRRRKRRLRIEPPLHALRRDPNAPRPRPDPNAPRLPDSTSALVGPRLNLHNRVQSLIRAGDLDNASGIARQAVFSNTRPTVFTCNAIMAAMFRSKRYDDAIALFQFFYNQSNIVPNVVSYNVLINTHCDAGRVDIALDVYKHIIANAPFSPSSVTYRHLTKGLIEANRIGEAIDLLREMLNKGHGADSLVYNNLISGFLNLENLEKANELFDELKERCLVYDGVVNATYMDWFFNKGKEKEAMESYKSLLDRQFKMVPATCNVLIEVLLKHGKKVEAWAMFETMLDTHTPPTFQAVNSDTFNLMVNDTFKSGSFSDAVDVFRKVGKKAGSKPFAMDVAGYNNIIARFCEIGMVEEAGKYFVELCGKSLSPDVNTYRTLIDAYFKAERVDDALQMYSKMVEAGLRVIPDYANRWFNELVENNKALECAKILTKMGERDPKPDVKSFDVVIRGLCREGNLDMSFDLLGQMVRFNVGVTPVLREFVLEAFGKEGRGDEVERLLTTRGHGFAPNWHSSGPPRMGGPSQMAGPPRYGTHPQTRGPPRMEGNPQVAGPPRMGGPPRVEWPSQMAGSSPRMEGNPQMEGSPRIGGHPRMEWPSQMAGPPQLQVPPQMGGPPQMAVPQVGAPSQTEEHPQMEERPQLARQYAS